MEYVLGGLVVMFLVALVAGTVSGRVKVRPCCTLDPREDARMRDAFAPADSGEQG